MYIACFLAILSIDDLMYQEVMMTMDLAVDNNLLSLALRVGGFKSKKETINVALKEFVEKHKQFEIIELFGQLPCDDDYDYKEGRK